MSTLKFKTNAKCGGCVAAIGAKLNQLVKEDAWSIDLKSPEMVRDNRPVVEGCDCLCCTKHTRSYVHHLLNVHEMLAETLLVMHNIRHYQRLFEVIRDEIQSK